MSDYISVDEVLRFSKNLPVIDVRTPSEYLHAHIPQSMNIPLFSDEERAIVGTIYNHQGKEAAIIKGLKFTGPRMTQYINQLNKITKSKEIILYCWRGGMRSMSLGWLYELIDKRVYILKNGYKAYRRAVLESFSLQWKLNIIGGLTGSRKTDVLHQLLHFGEQVVDLERLANHKGSAFGHLGQENQPSTQQFENLLFNELAQLDPLKRIWVEDESRNIGKILIPQAFWTNMRSTKTVYLDAPKHERIENLLKEYGNYPKNELVECIMKMVKNLGAEFAKKSIEMIENNELTLVIERLLNYYDKTYLYGQNQRNKSTILYLQTENKSPLEIAHQLTQIAEF